MKFILASLLMFAGATAFADYTPSIKCPISGAQTIDRVDAYFRTADAMYWDAKFPDGEKMLGYVFHRLNNSPDELSFQLVAQNSGVVVFTASLRKTQSVEFVSGPTRIKFW